MKITFLGTGTSQGVPIIACQCAVCLSNDIRDKRLRSSVLVETDGVTLVIDTGPDFRQQMLRADVRKLDAVLFTHGHKDHTAGFDDIRGFNFVQQRPMEVYGDLHVEDTLKREFHYAFADLKYPGVPDLNLHVIDNKPFAINGLEIIPIEVKHFKLPVLGFRMGSFTYITDANFISTKEKEKIRGTKVLVLNALRITEHISHFNLQQAIELATELEVEQTYFTHISHQMGFHTEVEKQLPNGKNLAFDGLEVIID